MNTFQEARRNIKFLASSLKGLLALDDLLGEAGTLEKAVADKQTELTGLEAKRVSVLAAIDEANKTASDIVKKARDQAVSIETESKRVKAAAEARALQVDGIIAAAQSEAASLVDAGHRDAAKAAADADGRLGALRKDIATAEAQKAAVEAAIAVLNQKYETAQATLASLRSKIG